MTRSTVDPTPLAIALRALRLTRGLSQEALAARAGVDRTYVQKIEKATKHPSFTTVARILDALGVSWAEFGTMIDEALQWQRTPRDTP